jgi:hypothetical protein
MLVLLLETIPACSTSPTPSPRMTPLPSLAGETPGPTNSAPAGATYIPNLSIQEVLAAAGTVGLACVSEAESVSGGATLYQLICSVDDAFSGNSLALTADYWTFDRIGQLHVLANPLGGTLDPARARAVLSGLLLIALAGPDRQAAARWYASHDADTACQPCVQTYGDSNVELQASATAGAGAITVHGLAIVP